MTLNISPNLKLPLDAVTRRLAFVGTVGSGKTYAAMKLAELMWEAKAQFCALDPVGVWWGLRLDANGKDAGIPIPVFGGLHGDIPLEPGGGAIVADLIVDRTISVVIDVSQFEHDTDKARFAGDFASRLFFRKKSKPSAIHLFLEECQEFVPQNPQKGEENMLHNFNRMWKIGRNFGIGGSLISQRPQEVNKKALNLSQCLFAFQTMGTHERKAIENWIEDKALDLDIANDLPKLKVGEPHVWAPAWLGISEAVKVGKKWTFNASATPEVGDTARARDLAPIDLAKLSEQMKSTIERAKETDPTELKKKIAELQRQLRTQKPTQASESAIAQAMERAKREAQRESFAQIKDLEQSLAKSQATMKRAAELLVGSAIQVPRSVSPPVPIQHVNVPAHRTTQRERKTVDVDASLTNPEQRIVDAIAWFESVGIEDPEQPAVAFLAGYRYGGGAYNNPRGSLRVKGLIEYAGDRLRLTDDGRALANQPEGALTTEELHKKVMSRLPTPEQRLLKPLLECYPDGLTNEELAERSGYVVNTGGFNNPRGRLRTLGLIEYGNGQSKAKSLLFLNQ